MHLESFDLNLLVAIEALMRRRSVTAAAEELHVTQSAMSSALRRARAHFMDEILYYDGHKMVPTPFGVELETIVPDLIAQLRALTRMRAKKELTSLQRQFTILASDYVSAVFVSEVSRRLALVAPGVTLSVLPFAEDAMRQFRRGIVDFLIAPRFALDDGFQAAPLFRDTFQCVMCRSNPLVETGFNRQSYLSSPLVVTNFFLTDGKSHFERWLDDQDQSIEIAAALPSFLVLPHYVQGTRNIATIHTRLARHFRGNTDLVFRDPPVSIPPLQENLVTGSKHQHDAEAQLMAELILDVGRALEGAPAV